MKTVSVLLSTYNSEKYLREQIDSVLNQKDVKINLFARDDGSKDTTCDILQEYQDKGLLTFVKGENLGFKGNFSWLINNAPNADYYACCDHDDVWLENKLINAVTALEAEENKEIPLLYFTSLNVVNEKLELITKDSHKHYNVNSKTLFIDHILMTMVNGCTSVFNEKLREIYCQIPINVMHAHDYTIGTIAASMGKVLFSSDSQILYRQHANNCYGFYKGSLRNMIRSVKAFFKYETKGIKYKEALIYYYYFFDKLTGLNKEFISLMASYKFNKKAKKQLRKLIKKNVENKTERKLSLFLLRFNKL